MTPSLRKLAVAGVYAFATLATAQIASAQARSTADGFSIGVFGASRAFTSTVEGQKNDAVYGSSAGIVLHGGFNEHSGIALRLQGGTLDLDAPKPNFAQVDLTYRYTFRRRSNQFRPFFDVGFAGYNERTDFGSGRFEQRAGMLTLALGGQVHFNKAVALEIVWSAAGGKINDAKLNGNSVAVADNTLGAGGLSLGLVFHP